MADDFVITGNRTESYLKFYKNIKNRETARAAASRLFNSPEIKEYIEARMKELDEELIGTIKGDTEYVKVQGHQRKVQPLQ